MLSIQSMQNMNLKLGLKGTNINTLLKLGLGQTNHFRINRITSNEQQENLPSTCHSPSSLVKFPKKIQNSSRQSCDSKRIISYSKRTSEQPSCLPLHLRQQALINSEKNQASVNLDVRTQQKKTYPKVRKCTCGDCQECLKDFAYFLSIISHDQSLPEISAKSWCIWNKNKSNKFTHYFGKRIHKVREIASLSKMMSAMTAIDFLKHYEYDSEKIMFEIRRSCTFIGGTSAQLSVGETYSLKQLLYGMMLPSGNDASIAIGQAIGLLRYLKLKNKKVNPHEQNWYQPFLQNNSKSYLSYFMILVNQKCNRMGLIDTKFFNPHGNDAYDQFRNASTCYEVGKMSAQFIEKYQLLKSITNTKVYTVERYNKIWENTNKLLDDGFQGIKTGINQISGPCLAAYYRDFIIIVLNSKSMNERWTEVKKIVRWIIKRTQ